MRKIEYFLLNIKNETYLLSQCESESESEDKNKKESR